jgi:hypothetical protein
VGGEVEGDDWGLGVIGTMKSEVGYGGKEYVMSREKMGRVPWLSYCTQVV